MAALLAAALAVPALAFRAFGEQFSASYPEGPVWVEGTLYWAEMGADRVMAWPGHGEPAEFFRQDGCGPTALARYREGEFLVLCHHCGSLVRVDGSGRALATIGEDAAGNRLRNPNDASADGDGGVWFTDPGTFRAGAPAEGAIYHLGTGGTLARHVTGLAYGNGVHVDRAGQRLLVSEHLARRVLAYPLTADGLGEPEVLLDFAAAGIARPDYPEAGPDGLEIGPDGMLFVAEYGAGRLHLWRGGEIRGTLSVEPRFVTNIAFGPDGSAAVTGAFANDRAPYPGTVVTYPPGALRP